MLLLKPTVVGLKGGWCSKSATLTLQEANCSIHRLLLVIWYLPEGKPAEAGGKPAEKCLIT
jgi:hypothetical protein